MDPGTCRGERWLKTLHNRTVFQGFWHPRSATSATFMRNMCPSVGNVTFRKNFQFCVRKCLLEADAGFSVSFHFFMVPGCPQH